MIPDPAHADATAAELVTSYAATSGAPRTGPEPVSGTEATAAALARLYDLDLEDDPGDLDLYLALARRTGGPILELAAGTGRLAVPLATAGYVVTGVDRDRAMLARARKRAADAGLADPGRREGGGRLELVEADVVGLTLPSGPFGLAFLALSSLLLLDGRDAQRAAFEALARHLARRGLAVVDVWIPAAGDLARYDGRLSLEHARLDPESGRVVTKLASAQHDPTRGAVTLTTIYEEGVQGEAPVRWTRTDRLRLVSADDLVDFAHGAGLIVEQIAGGYDLEPLDPASERAILIATRA